MNMASKKSHAGPKPVGTIASINASLMPARCSL